MAQKKIIKTAQKSKPVAKAKTVKTAPKAVKKAPVKIVAKKIVTKAPAKAVVAKKTVSKQPAKVVSSAKKPAAPVKAVKVMAKPVAKPMAKVAPKAVAKPAPVKTPVAVKAAAPVKAPVSTKSIVVKAPTNQNLVAKKAPMMMTSTMVRPAYRPIQVINKSLAPLQPVRAMAPAPLNEKIEYKKGDYVVYPAHGVGQIEAIESQVIAGMDIKLYAIVFEKDRMRLKVPVFKAHASGLRRLSTGTRMQDALKTLQGRAQIRRAMWSRRAQEYETKINSGDPVAIAEVLRDLKRSNDDTEQSYSERQIYQSAMERLAREVAAVERITEIEATERLEKLIRGGRKSKAEEKAIADKAALALEDKQEAA